MKKIKYNFFIFLACRKKSERKNHGFYFWLPIFAKKNQSVKITVFILATNFRKKSERKNHGFYFWSPIFAKKNQSVKITVFIFGYQFSKNNQSVKITVFIFGYQFPKKSAFQNRGFCFWLPIYEKKIRA